MLVMIAEKHLGYSGVSSAFDKISITFGKKIWQFFKEKRCTGYYSRKNATLDMKHHYIATDGSAPTWH